MVLWDLKTDGTSTLKKKRTHWRSLGSSCPQHIPSCLSPSPLPASSLPTVGSFSFALPHEHFGRYSGSGIVCVGGCSARKALDGQTCHLLETGQDNRNLPGSILLSLLLYAGILAIIWHYLYHTLWNKQTCSCWDTYHLPGRGLPRPSLGFP